MDRLRNHFGETDLVRICVIAPQFHIPHKLDLQPLGELNVKQIVDLLDNLLQSDEEILLTQGFQIHIGVARNPLGAGKKSRGYIYFLGDKCDILRNRATVKIRSNDNLCFSKSLAVCLAKERVNDISVSSGTDSPEYLKAVQDFKSMCDHRIKDQVIEAKRIQKLAGLNPKRAVSFLDIPKFELALNRRIVVFAPHIQNRVIYSGEKDARDESRKSLFLVFVRDEKAPNKPGHYHPIVKLQAFFRCSFFCPNCLKPASTTSSHCCDGYCSLCQHYPCTAVSNEISYCYDCCRTARSKACMIRHKKKGICDSLAKCSSCLKLYSRAEEHECGYRTCRVCGDTIATGLHHCSMRSKNPNDVGYRYMFADFEADPCDAEHVPNLIIAHWRCRDCIDIPYRQRPECSSCGAACILCRETVGLLAKGSEDREVCLIGEACGR